MKNLISSKHKGSLGDILGTAMCIVIMLTLLTVSIQYMKILTVRRNIEALARGYLLVLETTGELSAPHEDELSDSLRSMGFSNFTITYNDSNVARTFGEMVSLDIDIRAAAAELGLTRAAGFVRDSYDFKIHLVSISKAAPP